MAPNGIGFRIEALKQRRGNPNTHRRAKLKMQC
jgi:hypothetical protein